MSARTIGYLVRDVRPTGDRCWLAKCGRCGWAGTFSRDDQEAAYADVVAHLEHCRGAE